MFPSQFCLFLFIFPCRIESDHIKIESLVKIEKDTVFASNHHFAVIYSTRIECCHHFVDMNMDEWIDAIKRHGSCDKAQKISENDQGKEL